MIISQQTSIHDKSKITPNIFEIHHQPPPEKQSKRTCSDVVSEKKRRGATIPSISITDSEAKSCLSQIRSSPQALTLPALHQLDIEKVMKLIS